MAQSGPYGNDTLNGYAGRMGTASAPTSGQQQEPLAYFGTTGSALGHRVDPSSPGPSPMDSWGRTQLVPDLVPVSQAAAGFSVFNDQDFARISKIAGTKDPQALERLWAWAVEQSANAFALGQKMTPWEILEKYGKQGGFTSGGSGPRTMTSKSINLTDPETAKGIILSALRQALGRRASDKEIGQFRSALNTLERQNPSITTTHIDAKGNSTSTTTGGAPNPGAFAETFLDENKNAEMDAFRAGTQYVDVMRALSQSIV